MPCVPASTAACSALASARLTIERAAPVLVLATSPLRILLAALSFAVTTAIFWKAYAHAACRSHTPLHPTL
eukprot:COSAG01_NODE_3183_length_6447_cov_3.930687_3_plen_71_part_00